jgi:hypothetical protein
MPVIPSIKRTDFKLGRTGRKVLEGGWGSVSIIL